MRQRTRLAVGSLSLVGAISMAMACTGDDPEGVDPDEGTGTSSTSSTSSSGTSGAISSSSGAGSSGTSGSGTEGGTCTPGCKNASTLTTCVAPDEACQFGCSTTGSPHCQRLYPSGLVAPEMMAVAETKSVSLLGNRANALDGSMSNGVRDPNTDPAKLEVKNGIGFQRVEKSGQTLSVWMFDSLLISQGVNVHFSNDNPVAFVVAKEATILGVIDVRPYNSLDVLCGTDVVAGKTVIVGGPGGYTGGYEGVTTAGPGAGGNAPAGAVAGAGGGGFGGPGGNGGGTGGVQPVVYGGAGGMSNGPLTLVPLVGGSGGGGNGTISGGSGGGAIQLVVGTRLLIGDGTNVAGVNAGGCGGIGTSSSTVCAGGGGAGGAILVETPTLEMRANAGLAANGANAGGKNGPTGANTELSDKGIAPPTYGTGSGQTRMSTNGGTLGGHSGGGGVGRIRLNLRTSSFTVPANAILSPYFTTSAAATVEKADIH